MGGNERGGVGLGETSPKLGGKYAAAGTDVGAAVPLPSSSFRSMLFGPSSSPSSSAPRSLVAAFHKYDEDGGGTIDSFEAIYQ